MTTQQPAPSPTAAPYTIALAGQPNVGKATVFNMLAGLSQRTDTWPGVSIERKTGVFHFAGTAARLVVLPDTRSLSSGSLDERLARDFLIKQRPDAVILLVNAADLEHGLYVLSELVALPTPIVVGLNMTDTAAQHGIAIDASALQAAIATPVVAMSATRNQGVRELAQTALAVARLQVIDAPPQPEIEPVHQAVLDKIVQLVTAEQAAPYPTGWMAMKLLEGDDEITPMMQARLGERWAAVHDLLRQHEDAILAIASARYNWIGRVMEQAARDARPGRVSMTDRLDRVATHPLGGLAVFAGVMLTFFSLVYSLGVPLQEILEQRVVEPAAQWSRSGLAQTPPWLVSLIADGIIGGAGTVLTLLPILIIFFVILALLEDSGYIARAAYVVDRFLHQMGLHGNSFVPLFLAFGCNVPAILGAHVIDSPKARLMTILITPLVPCGARLAVVAVLTPIFFGANAIWAAGALLALSLAILIVIGVAIHELVLGGEHVAFIMELPLYQKPNVRTIALSVWQQTVSFIREAGSVILLVSVGVWALSSLPGGAIETSYLATFGRLLSPIGDLMGLEWPMVVALLTSFARKENTLATLGVLYGAGGDGMGLTAALGSLLTPAAAFAFLAVQLLFIPCAATVVAIQQETRSWRWTLFDVAALLLVSVAIGVAIYQAARLTGIGM